MIGFGIGPVLLHSGDTACGFWFLPAPFDLETVFREQFAPPFWLLFPASPWSSATNVQDAPRKNGLRSVCHATVTNPFELSSDFPACRSYLSSWRCPRFPSGRSEAQCPSLRHLAHLVRSFSSWILERFKRGPYSLLPMRRRGPKKPRAFCAALRSSRTARHPGCRNAGRACNNICGTSFSSTVVSWPSSVM